MLCRQVREEEAEKARARLERAEAVIEQERAARLALERRLAQQQSTAAVAAPASAAAVANGSAPSMPRSNAASPVSSAPGASLRRQVRLLKMNRTRPHPSELASTTRGVSAC